MIEEFLTDFCQFLSILEDFPFLDLIGIQGVLVHKARS